MEPHPKQITVNVASASAAFATLVGTAYVKAGYDTAYLSLAEAAMLALTRSLEIEDPLYLAAVAEAMMTPPGAVNWIPNPMFTEVVPGTNEVVTLTVPIAPTVVVV